MKDVSNKTILSLLAIALVVSAAGMIISLHKFNIDSSQFLTGAVSGTGTTSLTVSGTAGITISDTAIAFVSGYYNASCTIGRAFQSTDSEYNNDSCWLNTSSLNPPVLNDPHTIANSGTTALNVSANLSLGTSNSVFNLTCNVTNSCTAAMPHLLIKAKDNEAGSCVASTQTAYTNFSDNTTNTEVTLCGNLDYQDSADSIDVDFNLTIPRDAPQGTKSITIQYLGKAI